MVFVRPFSTLPAYSIVPHLILIGISSLTASSQGVGVSSAVRMREEKREEEERIGALGRIYAY
jgi:hypothetical protein